MERQKTRISQGNIEAKINVIRPALQSFKTLHEGKQSRQCRLAREQMNRLITERYTKANKLNSCFTK